MPSKMRTKVVVTAGLCAALTLTGASVALAEGAIAPKAQEQVGADAEASSTEVSTIGGIVSAANEATGKIALAYKGNPTIVLSEKGVATNSAAYVFANERASANVTVDFNGATIDASSCTFVNKASVLGIHGFKGKLTIKNLKIKGTAGAKNTNVKHCLNVFDSTDVVLENVGLENSATAGMVVNGSNVVASGLKASGNVWGSVNVDQTTSVPAGAQTSLKLEGENGLEDDVQIWTEKPGQCKVTADGYTKVVGGMANDEALKGFTYYTTDPSKLGDVLVKSDEGSSDAPHVYKNLKEALDGASSAQVALLDDVTTDATISIEKDTTIDLDGHTLKGDDVRVFYVKGGKLTLSGEGVVTSVKKEASGSLADGSSVIRVGDNSGDERPAELNVGEDITIEAPDTYGISVFGSKTNEKVDVYGKVKASSTASALSGNGLSQYAGTEINLHSGSELTATGSVAIYHPQAGSLNISGATIEGLGGIELKAGDAIVNVDGDTKVTATGEMSNEENNNGTSTSGYAVAVVENENYAGGASVKIGAGVFKGAIGIVADNDVDESKKGSLKISGGTFSADPSSFVTENGSARIVRRSETTGSYSYEVLAKQNLTEGVYLTDPSGALAEGYSVTAGEGIWTVTKDPVIPPSGGGGSTTPSDKTEVEQNQDGSTTTTVTKPDGSQTITHETATGTSSTVTKDEGGNVTSTEVTVSSKDADAGKVELPIEKSEPAADAEKAPEVEVKVPSTVTADKPVQVTVPVAKDEGAKPNQGVVVYAVDAEGNETVLPKCSVDKDGNVVFEATGDVTIKVVDAAKDMPDVDESDWFAGDVVAFATARGIVNGVDTPDGSKEFQGYGGTSRGMLVAMLHNLELNPEAASEGSLADVPSGAFYADAAAWALEEGILSGVDMPDGTKQFQGDSAVTREQVAVFLMRYAEALGMDVSARAEIDFPDASEVSGFAGDAMSWAVANGLFTGNDATGELNPTDGAARAEVAAVLMRFINLMYA